MKLATIFPVLNQPDLATTAIDFAVAFSSLDSETIILDNASDPKFDYPILKLGSDKVIKIIRFEKNIGVYATFWEVLKYTDADILAFFHTDLMLCESHWDLRVIEAFKNNPKLGLIGFVGSNEIDAAGGRGLGTVSNFKGWEHKHRNKDGTEKSWKGSAGSIHGKVTDGLVKAAVVDGCAMIFRREVLEKINKRENFPPHHFYDRLLSCEVQELGYDVAVLGIGCDHISGQSVNGSEAYEKMAEEWCNAHGIARLPTDHNWDTVIYHAAEHQWIMEYREAKKFIPRKV